MARCLTTAICLAALTFGAAACFNPELGEKPFRCALTGKTCPDDYVCNAQSFCVPSGSYKPTPDASMDLPSGFDGKLEPSKDGQIFIDGSTYTPTPSCSDHADEPNNTLDQATRLSGQGIIPGWEICHPGDVDHFWVDLNSGQKLVVSIDFKHSDGDLDLALLDEQGFELEVSRSEDSDEKIETIVTKTGKYIVAVWGYDGATNKYALELTIR